MINKFILLAIADAVDKKTGFAWRSLDALAKRTGGTRRTVIRSIQELKQQGLLSIQTGVGRHHVNRYKVLLPINGDTQSPLPDGNSERESPLPAPSTYKNGDRESRNGDRESPTPSYPEKKEKKEQNFSGKRDNRPKKLRVAL